MEVAAALAVTAVVAIAIAMSVASFYAIQQSVSVFQPASPIACIYYVNTLPGGFKRIDVTVSNTGGYGATVKAAAILQTPVGIYTFDSNTSYIPGNSIGIIYILIPSSYAAWGSIVRVYASSVEGVTVKCESG